MQPSAMLHE